MHSETTTIRSSAQRRPAGVRRRVSRLCLIAVAATSIVARGEPVPQRPDLSTAKAVATATLQPLAAAPQSAVMSTAQVIYTPQPAADDGQINYMRSARGEWQIANQINRDDPWNRLLLLSPRRPVVIDVAVFIDGKSYRAARESWIDEVLQSRQSSSSAEQKSESAEAKGTSPAMDASKEGPPPAMEQDEAEKQEPAEAKQETDRPESEQNESAAAAEIRLVAPQARQAPAIRERLVNYLETIGPSVSREEVRWLLAEWGSGPPLILLGPGLSWQRAATAPLWAYLDQNKDGGLNQGEMSAMAERLKQADFDANDVVEVSELRRADARPPALPYDVGHPLLVTLDENTNWQSLARELTRLYGRADSAMGAKPVPAASSLNSALMNRVQQAGAPLGGDELKQLLDAPADVTIRVDFGTTEDATKSVSIVSLSPEMSNAEGAITVTGDVITLDLGADYIEISAAGGEVGGVEAGGSQIAVGAAIDGDPLLRSIDRDQDGRLTMRERQSLADFVRGLDRNRDGQAASDEIPIPIRLAVTHGPQVHQLLATARPAARMPAATGAEKVAAPDWFVAADLNGDGDWSPNEFIGTPEQFRTFDKDGDGLLSPAEAIAAAGGE